MPMVADGYPCMHAFINSYTHTHTCASVASITVLRPNCVHHQNTVWKRYHGRNAHASMNPQDGINALDAQIQVRGRVRGRSGGGYLEVGGGGGYSGGWWWV
jgi:hypothetical protein